MDEIVKSSQNEDNKKWENFDIVKK
jgi:hypothetical protein